MINRFQVRFIAWVIVAVGLSAGQLGWIYYRSRESDSVVSQGLLILLGLNAALIGLLATTPPQAIRLRPRRSVIIVLVVSVLIQCLNVFLTGSNIILAAAAIGLTMLLIRVCVRKRISPWWAAVVGWSPLWVAWNP